MNFEIVCVLSGVQGELWVWISGINDLLNVFIDFILNYQLHKWYMYIREFIHANNFNINLMKLGGTQGNVPQKMKNLL
jgi:hypothetical protein